MGVLGMVTVGDYVALLNELGLSLTQARVYLAIAQAKYLSAKEIAAISKVARPDVYRAVSQLEKAGLVETILGEPKEFEAIPIDECFSTLLLERVKKTGALKEKALKLTRNFKKNFQAKKSEEVQFILIPKKRAIYAKAEKMTKNVKECVCFLGLTRRMLSWLSSDSAYLQKALDRKVNCRMILPNPGKLFVFWDMMEILGKYSNFALRLVSESPKTSFSVWDRKEILMTTSVIDSPAPAPTLWSSNPSIVDLCQEHFECIWQRAEKTNLNKN